MTERLIYKSLTGRSFNVMLTTDMEFIYIYYFKITAQINAYMCFNILAD